MTVAPGRRPELALHTLRLVFVLLIVATAIPGAIGPSRFQWWRWDASDILANILLYVPLGLALSSRASLFQTVMISTTFSTTVEIAQLFYVNRISHPLDVVFNVVGAVAGHAAAPHVRVRTGGNIRLSRALGAAALVVAPLWILSSRMFRMYLGGFGWFAIEREKPFFWPYLPGWVIQVGSEVHDLGLLANTAIAALLAATGVIGVLQARHAPVRAVLGALAGFSVGHMMTPHLNVYPIGPVIMGTAAGLSLVACSVLEPSDSFTFQTGQHV
jgi:VanZ family protein